LADSSITNEIKGGSHEGFFFARVVDLDDLKILVEDCLQSKIADADLNGAFNSSDFVYVFRAGKYEDTVDDNANWSEGDWNCDGDFTSRDLVFAF